MRLLSLIIAVLMVGFLVYKQLGSSATSVRSVEQSADVDAAKAPTTATEIQALETRVNDLVQDSAKQTAKRIDEATQR